MRDELEWQQPLQIKMGLPALIESHIHRRQRELEHRVPLPLVAPTRVCRKHRQSTPVVGRVGTQHKLRVCAPGTRRRRDACAIGSFQLKIDGLRKLTQDYEVHSIVRLAYPERDAMLRG